MKARVKNDMVHVMLDNELPKDTIIEVEHFAYGKFYTIIEPLELKGITIEKSSLNFQEEHK